MALFPIEFSCQVYLVLLEISNNNDNMEPVKVRAQGAGQNG